ncbi:MAG: right-handed parallel beta-helix repeat-containing protein [Candidatus Omnitrophica bacterium]|nr:right-handed parallel beta-helix repeat-containing protein [Candidatus Omnitrophota bacterium]
MNILRCLFILGGLVLYAGTASAATDVFYSVGQVKYSDAGGNLMTGRPSITISNGVATFSDAQTGNIGVGDRVTYGGTNIAYISGRQSSFAWNVITATGARPFAVAGVVVNSIGHEFSSLNSAMWNITNAAHLNTADLMAGNYILNIACYYDNGPDTSGVSIPAVITAAANYIRIYTPTASTEVNRSQRHTGKWTPNAYRLEVADNSGIVDGKAVNYLRIDGLQIKVTTSTLGAGGLNIRGKTIADQTDFRISNNIIKGVITGTANDNDAICGWWAAPSRNTMTVWNNIIYGWKNGTYRYEVGIRGTGVNIFAYNNTIYNVGVGMVTDGYSNTIVAKNNTVQNSLSGFDAPAQFAAGSTNNLSDHNDAPGSSPVNSATVAFTDPANGDFHIVAMDAAARNAGIELSAEFMTDASGLARPLGQAWDIGANEAVSSSDNSAPVITQFSLPAVITAATVPVTLTAVDNVRVAAYLIKDSPVSPGVNDPGWVYAQPDAYSFTRVATLMYAWVRDSSGNISTSRSQAVSMTVLGVSYYVDALAGNDANSGMSAASPWKTLARVNRFSFQPGDHILLKKGCVWRESLTVSSSGIADFPVVVDAYGSGDDPVISGADPVAGWALYSGNIFMADVKGLAAPTQLYLDGQYQEAARYPNSGYLLATTSSADTVSIVDGDLVLPPQKIVGSTVITRAVPWHLSVTTATAYDPVSHTISLSGNLYNATQLMRKNYGFYLKDMLWMLDSPGEWFYDAATGKLYFWTPNSDYPGNHAVEISSRAFGIQIAGAHYVTVANVTIVDADQDDVLITASDNVTLSDLKISGGRTGVLSTSLNNSAVRQCSVSNTLSTGIDIAGTSTNVVVAGTVIDNAGHVGVSPKPSGGGIHAGGPGMILRNNTITNSGYSGIHYGGDQTLVENNAIDHSCLVLTDCAGIYTSNSNRPGGTSIIRGNTITNSIGNIEGVVTYAETQAHGIYLDDLAHGYTVQDNYVSNTEHGIYIHSGHDNMITGNVVRGARVYGFFVSEDNSGGVVEERGGAVHNNTITNNTFETAGTISSGLFNWIGAGVGASHSQFGKITNFGLYDYNLYCHPNFSAVMAKRETPGSPASYSLADWQQSSGQDLHSRDVNASCASVLAGDVNGDGLVMMADAVMAAQFALNERSLTAQQQSNADISGDGKVTMYDAALIARKALGTVKF